MKFKINEAIERANRKGKNVLKKDVADRLFPGVSQSARQVNMSSLCSGKTKRIAPEWVIILCDMLDCSADFLFGRTNK